MDTKNIGGLLRQLRKEKDMTQEQLAEWLGVSGRTVSRWENGSNIPDLNILITLADFYDADIRELIDGERKCENMDKETKDTLKKAADYAKEEKKILATRMWVLTAVGFIFFMAYIILRIKGIADSSRLYEYLSDFLLGLTAAALVRNMMYCSGRLDRIREAKLRLFQRLKSKK